jgi:hypothetical protein
LKIGSCLAIATGAGLVVVLSLVLPSVLLQCEGPYRPGVEPEALDSAEVDTSLVTGEPCASPCWQGLLPGESTKQEALQALEMLSFVNSDTISVRIPVSPFEGRELIEWMYGTGEIVVDNEIVRSITVDLFYDLELQRLVEIIGEPAGYFVWVFPPPDNISIGPICVSAAVEFIWPEEGLAAEMAFDTRHPPRQRGRLLSTSDTLYVQRLTYSPPGDTPQYFLVARGRVESGARQDVACCYQEWRDGDPITLPQRD